MRSDSTNSTAATADDDDDSIPIILRGAVPPFDVYLAALYEFSSSSSLSSSLALLRTCLLILYLIARFDATRSVESSPLSPSPTPPVAPPDDAFGVIATLVRRILLSRCRCSPLTSSERIISVSDQLDVGKRSCRRFLRFLFFNLL